MSAKHLVVMAAGTGGHVIPGLAVAKEMQSRGWSVSWLGTTHGMENKLVPPSGIAMDNIAFSGIRGKGLLHTATGGLRLLAAFWSCLKILRRRHANAVLGMGGYVCFPGGLMASLLNKPLMLVNADASLLMSNKSLLPVGVKALQGSFRRGEMVVCVDLQGREVARGLANYSAAEAQKIIGQPTDAIASLLGYVDGPELVHRDNLVLV